jgi:DNA polymerase-3 subunit delta
MVALKSADIERFIARPDPARPITLIYGPDAGLVHERVERLIKASVDDPNDPFSLVRLNGDDLAGEPSRLVEEANTIPLFGGRRAVLVKAGGRNFAAAVENTSRPDHKPAPHHRTDSTRRLHERGKVVHLQSRESSHVP